MAREITAVFDFLVSMHDQLAIAEKRIGNDSTFRQLKDRLINNVIDCIGSQIDMLALVSIDMKDMRAELSKAQQEAAQAALEAGNKEEAGKNGMLDQDDYVDVNAKDLDSGQIIMWGGDPWLIKSTHQRPDDSVNIDVVNLIGERDPFKLTLGNEQSVLRWKAHN